MSQVENSSRPNPDRTRAVNQLLATLKYADICSKRMKGFVHTLLLRNITQIVKLHAQGETDIFLEVERRTGGFAKSLLQPDGLRHADTAQ